MLNRQKWTLALPMILAAVTISPCAYSTKVSTANGVHEKFDRNQEMLISLKSAPMSAGYYIIHSYGVSKEMNRDLDRALNQIVEVDKAFAKSRHRPDSRYLENACLKVTLAKQTAAQLQEQLKLAFAELKTSIEETIVTDSNFK